MIVIEEPRVREARTPRTLITSRINRTLTVQGILNALADGSTQNLISFDECGLILCERDEFQVWYATPGNGLLSSAPQVLSAAPLPVAEALRTNEIQIVSAAELQLENNRAVAPDISAETLCAAVVLPLSIEDETFGALMFASAQTTYAATEVESLAWLADHIAVAVQAARLRAQLAQHKKGETDFFKTIKHAFLHTLVRDVRLPLTGVVASLQAFESKVGINHSVPAAERQLLYSALQHGREMCQAIDDQIDVARAAERSLELDCRRTSIANVIRDLVQDSNAEAALRAITLETRCAALPEVMVDAKQLTRALDRLLKLAFNATPDGGIISLEAVYDDETHNLLISVHHFTDEPQPFDTELVCESLWEAAPGNKFINTDINLAVAARVAKAHGGTLILKTRHELEMIYELRLPV